MDYLHLKEFLGEDDLAELQGKKVSVIGLGGMGSSVAELLVRSGVSIRIIEKGRVEEEDLDRLSLFTRDDASRFKATQAKKILGKINPDVQIKSFNEDLVQDTLFLIDADLVVDCSGDDEISELIGAYCLEQDIPCLLGSIRGTRCVVASATDKKSAFEQVKSVKVPEKEGMLASAPHLVAGFLFTKIIKILTGKKVKRGVIVYNLWDLQFEDKKGKKK